VTTTAQPVTDTAPVVVKCACCNRTIGQWNPDGTLTVWVRHDKGSHATTLTPTPKGCKDGITTE